MRSRHIRPGMILLLIGSTLPSAFALADGGGLVVERTVAFVSGRPVLLSEVQLTKALLQLQESDAVERTIDEALMLDEASRLVSAAQPQEKIVAALQILREKAGTSFTEAALRRKALAQFSISTYIELRLRPLVRIEDAAVRRAFNERVAKDPMAPDFGAVAEGIREALERQALDEKIEEWVVSLRQRKTVRRVPPQVR